MRERILNSIDVMSGELISIAKLIHTWAELSFEEKKSSQLLANFLADNGFKVEKPIAGLRTAFKAEYGEGTPRIALLAEYDALPEIGHACGHNMIGTISAGAATALIKSRVLENIPGTVVIFGCPAEEHGAGKKQIIDAGCFEDIDAAMMIHPASMSTGFDIAYAIKAFTVEFFGKSAHAAADPQSGINALDAMVLVFNALAFLRQQLSEKVRVHGIITNGGQSFNTIPEYTRAEIGLRALTMAEVDELETKLRKICDGACKMTGCTSKVTKNEEMPEVYVNVPLARTLEKNYKEVFEEVTNRTYEQGVGSTDMGAVTQVVPAIHAYINITEGKPISTHTREFAKAANSEYGYAAMIRATKALALTCYDILANKRLLTEIKEYFASRRREI